jgi:hypothetical protein
MKVISLLIVKVLAIIGTYGAFAWAVIEFILYLVKDKVFNWWCVYTFFISIGVLLGTLAYSAVYAIKNRNKSLGKLMEMRKDKPKSKFKQRIEEAMNKANTVS